ncbi:MAG TPA: flagellar basal body-associated FliL family protein [Armatimonadota bacterium]|nr:flagellar basal body-associated FliL family protein [Armatimonadota bacterium]
MGRISTISGKMSINLIIIIILLVLLVGGGAFTFTIMSKNGKGGEKHEKLSTWKLDEFIVNLADRNDARYLKVSVVLEVKGGDHNSGGGQNGETASPDEAKARDTIITVLSSKYFKDLLTDKGKAQLKDELKLKLNEVLEETEVENIYFTNFAMQ